MHRVRVSVVSFSHKNEMKCSGGGGSGSSSTDHCGGSGGSSSSDGCVELEIHAIRKWPLSSAPNGLFPFSIESRPKKEAVMLFIVDGVASQRLLMTGVPSCYQSYESVHFG